jgi:hypothetical protein
MNPFSTRQHQFFFACPGGQWERLSPTSTVTGLTFTTAGSTLNLGPLMVHAPSSSAAAITAPIDFINLIPLWNRASKSISAVARATIGGPSLVLVVTASCFSE